MNYHPGKPAWAHEFSNKPIHCFFNKRERRWELAAYPNDECTTWREHPQQRGLSPWLRFIRAFGDQVDRNTNPFVDCGGGDPLKLLFIESDGHPTSDGRLTFCETYLTRRSTENAWHAAMRVFLANDDGWARIECYDTDLADACLATMAATDQQYIDEKENIEVGA